MNSSKEQYHVTAASVGRALPMILIALTAFSGNGLVLASVARSRSLRGVPGNMYVVNLAITDILASLIVMPFAFIAVMYQSQWVLPDSVCHMEAFLVVLFSNVTFLTLVCFSVYRYFLITSQRGHSQAYLWKRVKYSLLVIWLVGVIFSFPPLVGWGRYAYLQHYSMCTVDWGASKSYGMVLFVFVFIIPQGLMVHSYIRILKFIKMHNQRFLKNISFRSKKVSPASSKIACASEILPQPSPANLKIEYHLEEPSISQYPSSSCGEEVESVWAHSYGNPAAKECTSDCCNEKYSKENLGHRLNKAGSETTQESKVLNQQNQNIGSNMQALELPTNLNNFYQKSLKRSKQRTMRRISRETKLIRVLLVTVVAFYLCWLPFSIDGLLQVLGYTEGRPEYFQVVAFWMASTNTLCNPIIYVLLNTRFRAAFWATIRALDCCQCCKKQTT